MEETITVGELIAKLEQYDDKDRVVLYAVGFTSKDSYSINIELAEDRVDKFNDVVRISFCNF